MKNIKKIKYFKIFSVIFCLFLSLLIFTKISFAAEWNLGWEQIGSRVQDVYDGFHDVAQDSAYVYAVGSNDTGNSQFPHGIIGKFAKDSGTPIWIKILTSGTGGEQSSFYFPKAIAVASDGIYVVGGGGSACCGPAWWQIEKRSLVDGSIIWTQTEGYEVWGSATGVAVDSTGLYIIGTESNPPFFNNAKLEKRSLVDGALIWSNSYGLAANNPKIALGPNGIYASGFDNMGDQFVKIDPAAGNITAQWSSTLSQILNIAVDSSGVYLSGNKSIGSSQYVQQAAVGKYQFNGSLIWMNINPALEFSVYYGLSLIPSAVYAAGSGSQSPNYYGQWLLAKINPNDGTTLWSHSENVGGSQDDRAYGVVSDDSGIYVAGTQDFGGGGGVENGAQWRIEKRVSIPSTPNLAANAVNCSQIRLSWQGSTAVTRYELQRSDIPGQNWSDISTNIPGDAVNYLDYFGLTGQKVYFYQIRACNDNGCSEYSNITSATTPACPIIKLEVKDPATGLFTTGPVTISLGSSTELQWTTSGIFPNSCRASTNPPNSGNWHGAIPDNSSSPFMTDKITQNTTLYLTCMDSYTQYDVTNFVIVNTILLPQWKEVAP